MTRTFWLFALLLVTQALPVSLAQAQFGTDYSTYPTWARPLEQSLVREERYGVWLVEAQSVDKVQGYSVVSITHNFTGPDGVVGQCFFPSGRFDTMAPRFPLMPLGSRGIFAIKWDARRKRFNDGSHLYGYEFPAVERYELKPGSRSAPDFPPYTEALAYARSVERVAKAPRAGQISLLEMYARNSVPSSTRSVWAIATLAASGVESAFKFLLDLATNAQISTWSQLALDEQLRTLDSNGHVTWSGTPANLVLWQRLVTSPQSEVEAISIASDLLDIAWEESREREQAQRANRTYTLPLSGTQLFQWFRLAADNPRWTPFSRAFAVANVGELYKVGNDYNFELIPRSTTWTYLLPLLQSHPDFNESKPFSAESRELSAELAEGALAAMGNLRPFTPTEEATLRALQAKAKVARLKRIFDSVFDRQE